MNQRDAKVLLELVKTEQWRVHSHFKESTYTVHLKEIADYLQSVLRKVRVPCFIDNDDDGHWYIVPISKRKQWEKWLAKDSDKLPEYVTALNTHPNTIEFKEWSYGGEKE